jgi:hypothetical protein
MSPLEIAGIVFACVLVAALAGMVLRVVIPDQHFSSESRDTVKLVMGLIGTMAALILGLLVASAKTSYDAQNNELTQLSADVRMLDRFLDLYGPDARQARDLLKNVVAASIDRIWPPDRAQSANLAPLSLEGATGAFYSAVQNLSPQTDSQRYVQGQVLQMLPNMSRMRLLMYEQTSSSISWPFLSVLVFWLAILFAGFGMLTPRNATVIVTLAIGALSVAGAVFLILELSEPYAGLLQIPSTGVRNVLAMIGK